MANKDRGNLPYKATEDEVTLAESINEISNRVDVGALGFER